METHSEQIGEILQRMYYRHPFTNAAAVRQDVGLPPPGRVGGDCAYILNEVNNAAAHIAGDVRVHRAVSRRDGKSRIGRPGAHALGIKTTSEGVYAYDPYFLHFRPFDLSLDRDDIPSGLFDAKGRPTHVSFEREGDVLRVRAPFADPDLGPCEHYRFYIGAEDAVTVTGLENAKEEFQEYRIRFVGAGFLGQLTYFHEGDGALTWVQAGDGRPPQKIDVNSRLPEFWQKEIAYHLKRFGLTIESATKFLLDTPAMVGIHKEGRDLKGLLGWRIP